jgi:hypothetical protein
MKIGTSLGTVVPIVRDINELYNMMAHDAKVVGLEIQNKLQVFDLRVAYDREVLNLMMANIAAAAVSALEEFESSFEKNWRDLFEWHLAEYRRIRKEEQTKKLKR